MTYGAVTFTATLARYYLPTRATPVPSLPVAGASLPPAGEPTTLLAHTAQAPFRPHRPGYARTIYLFGDVGFRSALIVRVAISQPAYYRRTDAGQAVV